MGKEVFIDLTHPFSADIPRWPYFDKPLIDNAHIAAKGGVPTSEITYTMHTGIHCDASYHATEYEFDGRRARYTREIPVDTYIGDVVCSPIDIEPWGLITGRHPNNACEEVGMRSGKPEDMVACPNTGMHRLFNDSRAYYHYSISTGVEAGKWFVKYGVECVAMDSQALDHPLHTAIGNNGMMRTNLLDASGKLLSEEYEEPFGKEAYAELDKNEYIGVHGRRAYDGKSGELEALSYQGAWEPCHRELPGHGIIGMENLGGGLDKVNGKRFRSYCFPLRWYMGDGSMARCVARTDEEDLTDAPDRTCKHDGIGYQDSKGNGDGGLAYVQRLFDRNK